MTYSIIVFDSSKKLLGIGVASGSIAVGSRVPWAKYKIGGVTTQAYTNPSLGPIILELLKKTVAEEALKKALEKDEGREYRQIAVMDWSGNNAFWTGSQTPKEKSGYNGKNCVSIANLVVSNDIPKQMCIEYYLKNKMNYSIEKTILSALKKASLLGGDKRGDKSAGLLVIGETEYIPYYDKIIDIRVDDSDKPIEKLEEILSKIQRKQ